MFHVPRSTFQAPGFTLPELLVVMSIVSLMSVFLFVNWKSGQDTLALERSGSQVVQNIRRALELAIRADTDISGFQAVGSCAPSTLTGYGVSVAAPGTAYAVFAECNGEAGYQPGGDGLVSSHEVERGIELGAVGAGSQSVDSATITFTPPDPSVAIVPASPALAVVLVKTGKSPVLYSYTREPGTGTANSLPRALCDQDAGSNDCASSFPAAPSDPNTLYDWTGSNKQRVYQKSPQTAQTGQRTVYVNMRGLIQVE